MKQRRADHPPTRDFGHVERVKKKHDKLEMLSALIQAQESLSDPDINYIKDLKRRQRTLQNQLTVMRP